jgi:hypothetical protein
MQSFNNTGQKISVMILPMRAGAKNSTCTYVYTYMYTTSASNASATQKLEKRDDLHVSSISSGRETSISPRAWTWVLRCISRAGRWPPVVSPGPGCSDEAGLNSHEYHQLPHIPERKNAIVYLAAYVCSHIHSDTNTHTHTHTHTLTHSHTWHTWHMSSQVDGVGMASIYVYLK